MSMTWGRNQPVSEADDYCEACKLNVATKECGHGLLCDVCYSDIHGELEAECDL